jgi:hypothetical protein
MKIKFHIVLCCNGGGQRPRFQKKIEEFEITSENLESIINGSVIIPIISIAHTIIFKPRDWDRRNGILYGQAQMHSSECHAYQQSLLNDGWEEI